MLDKSLAVRYATALISVAGEQGIVAALNAELASVVSVINSTPALHTAFFHPSVSAAEKQKVAADLLSKSVSPVTMSFLSVLFNAKRINYLEMIADTYSLLCRRAEGTLSVRAVSAWPLGDEESVRIAETLRKALGKKIELSRAVDERLLGGVRLEMEDHNVIDGSLANRLKGMREKILEG
jgi:F-type H+-transporting ATPase subunit delta